MALNCAAIPETLLESELFGYEKGAFTDARAPKAGILEIASGGTIFLDEIGEMPLTLQAKLLRVLEEQTFRRLGGVRDIQVDVRVVAATNRKLTEAIEEGKFRLDLYYRLNVIQVVLPPLRERKEDILPLAEHFVRLYNTKFKRNVQGISHSAAAILLAHDWPGQCPRAAQRDRARDGAGRGRLDPRLQPAHRVRFQDLPPAGPPEPTERRKGRSK